MRQDSPEFRADNFALTKEPRFFVEVSFDDSHSERLYITSHDNVPVPAGGVVLQNTLVDASLTSQRLNVAEGVSEIGAVGFQAVDRDGGLTSTIHQHLEDGMGLRHKRVRVFHGLAHYTQPEQYRLFQTQIVQRVELHGDVYHFWCSDVQRTLKDRIFTNLVETELTHTVTPSDLVIPVRNIARLQTVQHGPSFSDAPNRSVFYVKLEEEYVRCSGVTPDGTLNGEQVGPALLVDTYTVDGRTFTGRGALGSLPANHVVSEEVNARAVGVREVVYLEMPAVKMALALLTGLNGWLPEHWHLGIPDEFIRLQEWQSIGLDWWNPASDTDGLQMRFVDLEDEEGKHFIESEIMRFLEAFMPVHNDGSLGLKRAGGVLPGASPLYEIDSRWVVRASELTHDMAAVRNIMRIDWGWDHFTRNFLNSTPLIDAGSINKHKLAPAKRLKFRGVHSSHYTRVHLENAFSRMRDRWAGPPLMLRTTLLAGFNELEVGDVVRLNLPSIRDFTTGAPLLRSMEVQSVRVNWLTGEVVVDWMGSSDEAGPPLELEGESGIALSDEFYRSRGTELTSAGIPTELVGGVLRILGGTLTGGSDINAPESIFYYEGDVELPADTVLTVRGNVQLRFAGHFQKTGLIDGKGRNNAASGFTNYGSTISGGGLQYLHYGRLNGGTRIVSSPGVTVDAAFSEIPRLELEVDDNGFLPENAFLSDLRGTDGRAGVDSKLSNTGNYSGVPNETYDIDGGAPGKGGAGLVIICRGLSHPPGARIDLSGEDGAPGEIKGFEHFNAGWEVSGGSGGGGHPGGCYILIDGTAFAYPNINTLMSTQMGDCPVPPPPPVVVQAQQPAYDGTANGTIPGVGDDFRIYSYYWGYVNHDGGSHHRASTRVQILFGHQNPRPERPRNADIAVGIEVQRLPNTPRTADGIYTTARVRMVPDDGISFPALLSHGRVFWQRSGEDVWHEAGPVTKTGHRDIQFQNDGATYRIVIRPVTIFNVTSPSGNTSIFRTDNVVLPDVDEKPSEVLRVPLVTGLQLRGQKGGSTFTGRDLKVEWRPTSYYDWFEFGAEPPGLGAGAGALDQYFLDYEVRLYASDGTLLRTEYTRNTSLTYSYEMNKEDGGPRRDVRVDVYMRSRQKELSRRPARIYAQNPASALPTGVRLSAGFSHLRVDWQRPDDLDFSDFLVWVSKTPGFTPGPGNLAFVGSDTPARVMDLDSGTTYYVRFAARDAFAPQDGSTATLIVSAEYTINTDTMFGDGMFGPWAFRLDPADAEFIEQVLSDDAIPSEKIANLAVGKLTTGTLIATVDIQSQGLIRARNADYEVMLGPVDLGGGRLALIHAETPLGDVPFAIYDDGGAEFTGEVLGSYIEGGQVVGAWIRTSTTGARTELTDDKLLFIDQEDREWARFEVGHEGGFDFTEIALGRPDGVQMIIGAYEDEIFPTFSGIQIEDHTAAWTGDVVSIYAGPIATALRAVAKEADGVQGFSDGRGSSSSVAAGVAGVGTNVADLWSYGVRAVKNGTRGAPMYILPVNTTDPTTYSAHRGALLVTSDGKLWINTTSSGAGTTWTLVGSQT